MTLPHVQANIQVQIQVHIQAHQGYRKFETVQYNRILNLELSDTTREILQHFNKVSKLSKICLYTLQDNLEQYNHLFYCSSIFFCSCSSIDSPLDCWTQHCPTIEQLDTALSNPWKVGHRTVRPLDSWKKHILTIGLLDTQLTSHWAVGHSINQPLDYWTQHCPNIGHCDKTLSDNHCHVGHSTV